MECVLARIHYIRVATLQNLEPLPKYPVLGKDSENAHSVNHFFEKMINRMSIFAIFAEYRVFWQWFKILKGSNSNIVNPCEDTLHFKTLV